jgi:hypothetical protein
MLDSPAVLTQAEAWREALVQEPATLLAAE